MQAFSLGQVNVVTPGTPVQVTTDATIRAQRIRFAAVIGQTGRTFVGLSGFNKTTGAGVLKELWTTGVSGAIADEFWVEDLSGANGLQLSEYWVDANVANEDVMVAYWTK